MTVSAVGGYPYAPHMTIPSGGILIGYARCSTDEQDLTAQRLAGQDPDLEPDRSPGAPHPDLPGWQACPCGQAYTCGRQAAGGLKAGWFVSP